MVTLIPVVLMILYFAVLVYLISLFSRLVHAVETIARKFEGPSKI